ncbi:MMPL family transporter [Aestuariirhabdus litorea]|nr:MMPL family transporter [Aestuariirhabdus litorea]
MLLLLWQATLLFGQGVQPRTSLLELLPRSEQQPAVQQALERFSQHLSRQLLLLVRAEGREQGRQSARALAAELASSGLLSELQLELDPSHQQALASLYFDHRHGLLSPDDRRQLLAGGSVQLREQALQALYNPFSGVTGAQFAQDPFGLFRRFLQSILPAGGPLEIDEGMLVHQGDDRYEVLLRATLNSDPFDLNTQRQLLDRLQQFLATQPERVTLLRSGALFYAAAGADSAREEISTIGLGSLCGVLLLVLWVFRSFTPLFIALLSIGSGVLTGLVCTLLLFGQIHLFTLVMGACLIGVSIDYAFHYFAEQHEGGTQWQPLQGLGRILAALTLGLASSLLGYSGLLATPFPGLQQLALFSCSGLLVAWLTVVLVYPSLLQPCVRQAPNALLPLYRPLITFWQGTTARQQWGLLLLLGVIALAGILRLQTDDDVRQLQSLNSAIQAEDEAIRKVTSSHFDNSFILFIAGSNEQLLQAEERFLQSMIENDGSFASDTKSTSAIIPSLKKQNENFSLTKKLYDLELINLPEITRDLLEDTYSQNSDVTTDNFLTISELESSGLQKHLSNQWLDNSPYGVASVMLFAPERHAQIKALGANREGVYFISQADDTSDILARYRHRIAWMLAAAYLVIGLMLCLRYGPVRALKIIAVPLLAAGLALGVNGWSGQAVNLFHLLALLLLLGISIDYALFFAERGDNWQTTLLGVTLAAITTLLSFGLLSLSATPAISAFGQTLLVGLLAAYLLAPLASSTGRPS